MRILVTGAGGFVGRRLSAELAARLGDGDELILADLMAATAPAPATGHTAPLAGDLADDGFVRALFAQRFDVVYHLATLPGRAAEEDFTAGKRANLDGTVNLLEAMREAGPGSRLVFASSAASYGSPLPDMVDDASPLNPSLSYAAHKAACEILINDYTRRGFLDGLSLRLSGILARPDPAPGNASAFLHDMIHAAREGRACTVPMAADRATWIMSVGRCVDNLLHAGSIDAGRLPRRRNWALPVLRVTMTEMIAGLARRFGGEVSSLYSFTPVPAVEAIFAQPPLVARMAEDLGFRADQTIDEALARCGL